MLTGATGCCGLCAQNLRSFLYLKHPYLLRWHPAIQAALASKPLPPEPPEADL